MEWQVILALVVAVPIVLFPAAFVWYLDIGGLFQVMGDARAKRRTTRKTRGAVEVKGE